MTLELLNETEAARMLRLKRKTLQSWRLRGCGPRYVKIGRLVFYRPESILKFVSDGERRSTAEVAR